MLNEHEKELFVRFVKGLQSENDLSEDELNLLKNRSRLERRDKAYGQILKEKEEKYGYTLLELAALNQKPKALKMLLELSEDPAKDFRNLKESMKFWKETDNWKGNSEITDMIANAEREFKAKQALNEINKELGKERREPTPTNAQKNQKPILFEKPKAVIVYQAVTSKEYLDSMSFTAAQSNKHLNDSYDAVKNYKPGMIKTGTRNAEKVILMQLKKLNDDPKLDEVTRLKSQELVLKSLLDDLKSEKFFKSSKMKEMVQNSYNAVLSRQRFLPDNSPAPNFEKVRDAVVDLGDKIMVTGGPFLSHNQSGYMEANKLMQKAVKSVDLEAQNREREDFFKEHTLPDTLPKPPRPR